MNKPKYSLILLMAGSSSRAKLEINKTRIKINNIPLYLYSLNKFDKCSIDDFFLVVKKEDEKDIINELQGTPFYKKVKVILGGASRSESVKNALKEVKTDFCLIHDSARPCISESDILNLINEAIDIPCAFLGSPVADTLRKVNEDTIETIPRKDIYQVSTPEIFRKDTYDVILNNQDNTITDEISLFNKNQIKMVLLNDANPKYTYPKDLEYISYLLSNKYEYFVGHSLDYHPFSKSGTLVLGGIDFEKYPKLVAHSDGDVILHAVSEALLGSLGLGDLGTFFPDTDEKTKDIDSKEILKFALKKLEEKNFIIQNIDVMVYLEEPKLQNYKSEMAQSIKNLTNAFNVCVKAATLNKGGLIALKEGIGAEATVLIKKFK